MANITLPELGQGIDKATVACWHKNVGEKFTSDDDLVEVVTDKASFNIPALGNGQIKQILVAEGQVVKVGEVLAVIE